MKINLDYKKTEESIRYLKRMVTELSKFPRKHGTTTQCESTQKIQSRVPSLDELHSKRSIDLAAAHADKYYVRPMTVDEILLIEGMRYGIKNTLGQSEESATTIERREKAIHAFTYSKPAPLNEVEIEKLTQLVPIEELTEMPRTPTWFEKILDKFNPKSDVVEPLSYYERQLQLKELEKENK